MRQLLQKALEILRVTAPYEDETKEIAEALDKPLSGFTKSAGLFATQQEKLINTLLPNGDNYTIHLAYSQLDITQLERFGYLYIGTGTTFACGEFKAYISLK